MLVKQQVRKNRGVFVFIMYNIWDKLQAMPLTNILWRLWRPCRKYPLYGTLPRVVWAIRLSINFTTSEPGYNCGFHHLFKYLIEAVLGQLKTRLISPKNFPSFIVAKTTLPSSLTTSTVPRLMKNICVSVCVHSMYIFMTSNRKPTSHGGSKT